MINLQGKMADFLLTEAVDEDEGAVGDDEGNIFDENMTLSDEEFIDDSVIEESITDHYGFTNVSRDYTEAVDESFSDFDFEQEPNNYCNENEIHDLEIDNFKDYKSKIEKFTKTLLNRQGLNNKDSFFHSILFAVRYQLTCKFSCNDDDVDEHIKVDIGAEIFDEFYPIKSMMKLDLDILNFESQCLKINQILNKNNLFLCVFELKEKFRCLIKQDSEKKNLIRDLSAGIVEKFNGFNIVRIEFDRKLRQKMSPIDIIYKPVRKEDEIIECFFSSQINLAYRSTFNENQKLRHSTAFQCYFCSNYYARKDKFDRHFENCSGKPGYVYNFNMQSLLTFEENLKFKRDIPLTAYIDFETTALTDDCLDPETKKTNAVSYVIIFAFHPDLDIKSIITERSFGHSIEKLTTIDYLTAEQLKYKDTTTLKQLRDCAISVANKKIKLQYLKYFQQN